MSESKEVIGNYSVQLEDLFKTAHSLLLENRGKVIKFNILKNGESVGSLNISGGMIFDKFQFQVEDVKPAVFSKMFHSIAMTIGTMHPGGVYTIPYNAGEEENS